MGGGAGETVQAAPQGANAPSSPRKFPAQIQQLLGADAATKPEPSDSDRKRSEWKGMVFLTSSSPVQQLAAPVRDWVSPQDDALEQQYHCLALGT